MGKLVDIPLHELCEIFSQHEVAKLHDHQEHTMEQPPADILWERALPKPSTPEDEEKLQALYLNVTEFDDDIEDTLATDPLLLVIQEARKKMPEDTHVINALRARRCVAALQIVYAASKDTEDSDIHQVA